MNILFFIRNGYSNTIRFERVQPFWITLLNPKWPGLFLDPIRDHSNTNRDL